jgi:hypothetical protein
MQVNNAAFNWDMLGSAAYVAGLASRLPAREVNALTPRYRNIVARNIIVEKASQFVKINGIPESPLASLLIENATITCDKLFSAHDAKDITIRNATIQSQDSVITLLDSRRVSFENVRFTVPGNELFTKISGELSDSIQFLNCSPQKPKGWLLTTWNK